MFTKLPRWVEIGGFWLALMAGAINAIGLLGFEHQGVSHLTGTSTLLGASLIQFNLSASTHLFLIIVSFMFGAALSGAIIDGAVLRLGRRYSVALLLEAALLFGALFLLSYGSNTGHFLASAACGLQNGMVSTYSGAVIRTTHVSGLFTDLGTMLGARLRGHPIDRRKALLFLLLILGFILGGSVGAYSYQHLQFMALALPAGAAIALAIIYWIYQHRSKVHEW
ncbi:YoaK family protein [Thiofilum flexile]|uniref:YoaK family protein n=1 Tax=Thiofilum flexile TaxID=125627 RepID=UPI00037E90C8|nr:YoaK family protein [Thiofilum flexile]